MPELYIDQFSGWQLEHTVLSWDIAKVSDWSAYIILNVYGFYQIRCNPAHPEIITDMVPRSTGKMKYEVVFIRRFEKNTDYPTQMAEIDRVYTSLKKKNGKTPTTLLVDRTGIGECVYDCLRHLHPIGITFTAGDKPSTKSGGFNCPKKDIVSAIQRALGYGELRISMELPLASVLIEEAVHFEATITNSDRVVLKHRDGENDDILLSLGLALWYSYYISKNKLRTFPKSQIGL